LSVSFRSNAAIQWQIPLLVERPVLAEPGPTAIPRWGSPIIHPHLAEVDPFLSFGTALPQGPFREHYDEV